MLGRRIFLIFVVSVAAVLSACSSDGDTQPTGSLEVITTIYPVTYFSERVGGDLVKVTSLIRPGIEAHDFEPTPGDIRAISAADVLVYVNPAFEQWISAAVDASGGDVIVAETAPDAQSTDSATDDGHDHGGIDPHVWLDPLEAIEQVRVIETAFARADPYGADVYRQNADALVAELEQLDREFTAGLSSCTLDEIVVSHEAYGHLAERYELHQAALAGLSAEFESTPQKISAVISEMRARGIEYILQEPIVSDALAKTVAAESGAVILPLTPLESLTDESIAAGDTYFTQMRANLESLRIALECS
jgi:zinc transport system substrate-binding protein